jgi:hypothetical protein
MDSLNDNFELGDSVVVDDEVDHPDLDYDISGWQGRVIDVEFGDEVFGTLIGVEWDSITLRNLPREFIEEADEAGIDWTQAYLLPEALIATQPRDEQDDVTRVSEALSDRYETAGYGDEETGEEREARSQRIAGIVAGAESDEALKRWSDHLEDNLTFPFTARVRSFQEQGPLQEGDLGRVDGISLVDEAHGIIVRITHNGEAYDLPLSALSVEGEPSSNFQLVDDYSAWWDGDRELD